MKAIPFPSPNWGKRYNHKPVVIVEHIADGPLKAMLDWFAKPESRASSNYIVCGDGTLLQVVPEFLAAWCNGEAVEPVWTPPFDPTLVNLYSISIEHPGNPGREWTEAMYLTDRELVVELCAKYGIPANRLGVIGHCDLDTVNRANDPGPTFPWERLYDDLAALLPAPGLPSWAWREALANLAAGRTPIVYPPFTLWKHAVHFGYGLPLTNEFSFYFGGQEFQGQVYPDDGGRLVYAPMGEWHRCASLPLGPWLSL
jgi:N-acetyl-anhydromuramyl-L-alanine amidase AmpD